MLLNPWKKLFQSYLAMPYKSLKTIDTVKKVDSTIHEFNYQIALTPKLDKLESNFDQEIINEIVLWKVNRYAGIKVEALELINQIDNSSNQLNKELTTEILKKLLDNSQRGIQLAMASTILRFKNPEVYQIIDQRVYRFITGEILNISKMKISEQINLYFDYLSRLRQKCIKYKIEFKESDRILYLMDKNHNKKIKLK